MNSVMYFEIQADKPEQAVRFYSTVFGWRFEKQVGLPVEYWLIETEGIRGGMLKRPALPPPQEHGTNAYVCSVEVADFDAVARAILNGGGQIALPKFAVPGVCWQGYLLDTEGNTFGIF